MNIISSLPSSRPTNTEPSGPAKLSDSQRQETTLPAKPDTLYGQPDSERQQYSGILPRTDFNNDLVDLRQLNDSSLSLTSRRAIVTYSVTSRIDELTSGLASLDIRA